MSGPDDAGFTALSMWRILPSGCDVERPSPGHAGGAEDAVPGADFLGHVAEDRIVRLVHLGELRVVLERVGADHVVRDVVLPDEIAALTERLAFGRSTTGKRLGKPREHHRPLAFGFRQRVGLAIRSGRRERGGHVTDLQCSAGAWAIPPYSSPGSGRHRGRP